MTKLHVGILCAMVGDQDEALQWYTSKLGFELRGDVTYGDWRWVTVGAPDQPDFEISLINPDVRPDLAPKIREMMALGGLNGIIVQTDDCRAAYEELKARGVEFTSEPEDVFYGVDCGFRDPFGNGFRLTQVAPVAAQPSPETMPSA
jgi:uncharacterized glyoxalase superfamily protein PhnB